MIASMALRLASGARAGSSSSGFLSAMTQLLEVHSSAGDPASTVGVADAGGEGLLRTGGVKLCSGVVLRNGRHGVWRCGESKMTTSILRGKSQAVSFNCFAQLC